jgi:hypothetical protein
MIPIASFRWNMHRQFPKNSFGRVQNRWDDPNNDASRGIKHFSSLYTNEA